MNCNVCGKPMTIVGRGHGRSELMKSLRAESCTNPNCLNGKYSNKIEENRKREFARMGWK